MVRSDEKLARDKRLIGEWVRRRRVEANMTLQELAWAMQKEGHNWTAAQANLVQVGRIRHLHVSELWALTRIFGVSADEALAEIFEGEAEARGAAQPDPEETERRIGRQVRELRVKAGMHKREVAKMMSSAGHLWDEETVAAVEKGDRALRLTEVVPLARTLNASADELLMDALGDPGQLSPELDPKVTKFDTDLPPFSVSPELRERVDRLAKRLEITRNSLFRRLLAAAVPAFEKHLDERGI